MKSPRRLRLRRRLKSPSTRPARCTDPSRRAARSSTSSSTCSTCSTACTSTRWRTTSTSSRRGWISAPAAAMGSSGCPRRRSSARSCPSSSASPRSPRASPPRCLGTSPPVSLSGTSSSWRRSSPWESFGSRASSTRNSSTGCSEPRGPRAWTTRCRSGSARPTGRWSTPSASLSSTPRSGMTSWAPPSAGASGWSWSDPRRNRCRATGRRWSSSSSCCCSGRCDRIACPTRSAPSSRTPSASGT
mmetsp:Transcript_5025/g.23098  ORF Transcript_5025/g.23098 Transcript_5025/m.23098 type:complete len:245 (-) Transcript_5025:262-996(-)